MVFQSHWLQSATILDQLIHKMMNSPGEGCLLRRLTMYLSPQSTVKAIGLSLMPLYRLELYSMYVHGFVSLFTSHLNNTWVCLQSWYVDAPIIPSHVPPA